jgi:integrase
MARGGNLDARTVEAARPKEKAYRLSDGGGLLLEVSPTGAKKWLLRVMVDGRRRDAGLGGYPTTSLKEARQKAADMRRVAAEKRDPIAERTRQERAEAARQKEEEEREARTFRHVAEALIRVQSPAWTSDKTLASWRLTLDKHGYPALGALPIADIGRAEVIAALSPVWTAQPATARKLQRRIAAVLDFAAANGWRPADNPAHGRVLRLTKALPPMNTAGRRQASLPWQRVPAFIRALEGMSGASPLALRFAALTALRSAEIRFATWSEMDFGNDLWTVPGRRMKGGRAKELPPHRVPLTTSMKKVLAEAVALRTGTVPDEADLARHAALLGDALVFGNTTGGPLSDAALVACIKRMNDGAPAGAPPPWRDVDGRPATAHGLRRSFRTWVDDERPEDAAAAEKQLAHEDANKVSAAYRGSDLLARRRVLMAAWGDFLTPPAATRRRARSAA